MLENKVSREIAEEASDWLERLRTANKSEQEAFADWVLRSPVHVEEFLRVSELHAALSCTLQRNPEWVTELLEMVESNVVPLHSQESGQIQSRKQVRRVRWPSVAAGFIVLVAGSMFAWWQGTTVSGSMSITTALGEHRSVLLSDGSTVTLNTDSHVRLDLNAKTRDVRLVRGEALFEVAKDPNRPFRVYSDNVVVQAIGTEFTVYRHDDETRVTVVEGRVLVDWDTVAAAPSVAPPPSVQLGAGMQVAVVKDDPQLIPVMANLEKAKAWTDRRLIFDRETVADIVAEFNRYNREQLICGDPSLGSRRLGGVFNANDPDEFIELLSGLEAIEVRRTSDGHRVLLPKTSRADR